MATHPLPLEAGALQAGVKGGALVTGAEEVAGVVNLQGVVVEIEEGLQGAAGTS